MHSSYRMLAASMLGWMLCAVPASGAQQASAIQVRDSWIRWLPGDLPAGGYVTLVNASEQAISLIAVSCPDYGAVTLHRSRSVGGTSQMMPVAKITLAAHSSLEFATQGYHLMLEHARRTLRPGDRVPVTLKFDTGAALTVPFEIRAPDAPADRPDMPGMAH
jgi:periplasmic copper chaperone A